MGEPGVAKVKLHKQTHEGLVSKAANDALRREDASADNRQQLTKEDFEKAADKAEEEADSVTQRVQQGTASILGRLQEALLPKSDEPQTDPEVKQFRAAAAEAAAEAKAYMQPGSEQKAEQKPAAK